MMQFGRTMKYQREADPAWSEKLRQLPGCEHVSSCIQCGTCSGTCPLSIYMDFTPRRVISLIREGFREDVLSCQTIWLCASCYACAAHCPQQIHITDVMYNLKREAIREEKYPKRFPVPVLAREFYEMVRRRGRSSEFWLVIRLALKTNPLMLLGMARNGWDLFRTGRLTMKADKIKGVRGLQRGLSTPRGVA